MRGITATEAHLNTLIHAISIMPRLTEHLREIAVRRYKSGEPTTKISRDLGTTPKAIADLVKKRGVKIRSRTNSAILNHRYFNRIDTPQKAYWLGFLMADGCVSSRQLDIALKSSDAEHLRLLAKNLGSNLDVKIQTSKGYERARLTISSPQMVKDLEKHGVIPRKSLQVKWPSRLPKNLEMHFIRGLFDGDGCITRIGNGSGVCISITGYEPFLLTVQEKIKENLGCRSLKFHRKYGSIGDVRWTSLDDVTKIMGALYYRAFQFLPRKKMIWKEFLWFRKTKHCFTTRCRVCHPHQYIK